MIDTTLTLAALRAMADNEVILWGEGNAEEWGITPPRKGLRMRWVAFRTPGGWTIRHHFSDRDGHWIRRFGNTVTGDGRIRSLVPCDDETFEMYIY